MLNGGLAYSTSSWPIWFNRLPFSSLAIPGLLMNWPPAWNHHGQVQPHLLPTPTHLAMIHLTTLQAMIHIIPGCSRLWSWTARCIQTPFDRSDEVSVRTPDSATTSAAIVESTYTSATDLDSHQCIIDIVDPMPCQTIIKSLLQGNIASRANHSFNLTNMPRDMLKSGN